MYSKVKVFEALAMGLLCIAIASGLIMLAFIAYDVVSSVWDISIILFRNIFGFTSAVSLAFLMVVFYFWEKSL